MTVYVAGFPANSEIDYRVGQSGEDFSVVYDGTVGSDGSTNQTITIPSDAANGEYWVVQVITTSLANVTAVNSHTIYISDTSTTTYTSYYARVSVSATQAAVGGSVTVSVSGFPANTEIDYRLGEQGQDFSVVYDGTTNAERRLQSNNHHSLWRGGGRILGCQSGNYRLEGHNPGYLSHHIHHQLANSHLLSFRVE